MSTRVRLSVALVSTGLVAFIAVGSLLTRVWGDTSYGQLAVFNEVVRIVIDGYVEPINLDRTMAGARLGLMDALDGDSAYLGEEDLRLYEQDQKAKDANAEIGVTLTRRFAFLMVVSVRADSPAEKAGIRPGDIVKTIDGRHTRPLAPPLGERLTKGAPGSTVKISLLRPGSEPIDTSVVRERLVPAPPTSRTLEDGTGYVRVREFVEGTADEVRGLVEALKKTGVSKLVLDLRGAGRGQHTEGIKLAEVFVAKGSVVAKLTSAHRPERVFSSDGTLHAWDQPVAVLTDNGTAGPGEIVAAALKDAGRGPVVGEQTFGRAAVQRLVPIEKGGLILTVAKYASPKGEPLHGRGVEPTAVVETTPDDAKPGEAVPDAVLDKALELLGPAAQEKKAA
jgi:carboxyl-terminal processing protease